MLTLAKLGQTRRLSVSSKPANINGAALQRLNSSNIDTDMFEEKVRIPTVTFKIVAGGAVKES